MRLKNKKEVVKNKIYDKQLRQNLNQAMHTLQRNRANLIENRFVDWQGLRERAKDAKNHALSTLKDRLLEFEKNATKNGFIVHWASSSDEACKIVYDLMKEKNIGEILKGKSMASEEIGLNAYLEQNGIKAIETDLGEVIIQLIGDHPVHIVVPAIHKNRYEVGQIFHDKFGAPLENEPEKLNEIARNQLRKKFKTLKLGLGGVNWAISKDGAVWMIENEGNGRMCTTMADITVHICGIEKVVETFQDAITCDTLLPVSATGQFIANYNNIITGPRKKGELDGPKECHIILLDNHRTDMLLNDEYYEALRCIRCGACMNFCPVYDKIGGHAYQAVYPGPIGEVISPNIFGIDTYGENLTLCSLCGRCSEVCPVKIPLANLIRKLKRDSVKQGKNPPFGIQNLKENVVEKLAMKAFANAATSGFKFKMAIKSAIFFNGFIHKNGNKIPVIKNWLEFKNLWNFDFDLYKSLENNEGIIYE